MLDTQQNTVVNVLREFIERDEAELQEAKAKHQALECDRDDAQARLNALVSDTQQATALRRVAEVAWPSIKSTVEALRSQILILEPKREDGRLPDKGGWLRKYQDLIRINEGFMTEISHHRSELPAGLDPEREKVARLKLTDINTRLKPLAGNIKMLSDRIHRRRMELPTSSFSRITVEHWRIIFQYASTTFHPYRAGELACDRPISTSIHALSRVCRQWRAVIYHDRSQDLWRRVYLNYEGFQDDSAGQLLHLILNKAGYVFDFLCIRPSHKRRSDNGWSDDHLDRLRQLATIRLLEVSYDTLDTANYAAHLLDALPTPRELIIKNSFITNTRLLYLPRDPSMLKFVETTDVELVLEAGRHLPNLKILKLQANTPITPCIEFYSTYSKATTINLIGGKFHLAGRPTRLHTFDAHRIRGMLNSILNVFDRRAVFPQLREIALSFPSERADMPEMGTWRDFLLRSGAVNVTTLIVYSMEHARLFGRYLTALVHLTRLRLHGSSVDPLMKELTWQVADENSQVLTDLAVLEIHEYDGNGASVMDFYEAKLASPYKTLRTIKLRECPNILQDVRQICCDD